MFSYATKSDGVQPISDPNFNQVSLLLHGDGTNGAQNNTFLDSSANNFTVTRNGNTTQGTVNPFVKSPPYSPSVNGGSLYFDGTADYLTVNTNAAFTYGLNNFTIECWVYLNTTGTIRYIIDQRNSGTANAVIPAIYVSASNVLTYFVSNAAQITGTTALVVGTWYHVAVARSASSTKMFLNGVQEGSTYNDVNSYVASRVVVASNAATIGNHLTGFISNVRLVNGTAVYTANFTPPTAPLTAITNTSLLLSGTNAGIFDNAMINNLETVGTAQVSTSVVKYGTGSVRLSGGSNYLTFPSNTQLTFGSGDFTVEFWLNLVAFSSFGTVFTTTTTFSTASNLYITTNLGGNGLTVSTNAANFIVSSSSLSLATWYHVAVVRNGTIVTLYLNGVSVGSATNTTGFISNTAYIGTINTGSFSMNGYVDDFRITKGVARYLANFTPPTEAFPNQ
jgi:hypothetical protein